MSGSTTGIIFIVVIIVLGLALWLAMVARAARRPAQEHPQQDQMRGLVQGGQHVGGGRSVAPTRDAPVPEGGGDPPDAEEQAEEQKTAYGHRPPGEDRGNPLDLE